MKKLFIFDVDGVLLETKTGGFQDILFLLGKEKEAREIQAEYEKRRHLGPWGLEETAALYEGESREELKELAKVYVGEHLASGAEKAAQKFIKRRLAKENMDRNSPPLPTSSRFFIITALSFSGFTQRRQSLILSLIKNDGCLIGRCDPGINIPCLLILSSSTNKKCFSKLKKFTKTHPECPEPYNAILPLPLARYRRKKSSDISARRPNSRAYFSAADFSFFKNTSPAGPKGDLRIRVIATNEFSSR